MAVIKFYGRERELALLSRLREPFFAVVYGRRRIGKTALVLKFLEGRDHLYFFVNPKKSSRALLEEYGEALREAMGLPSYVKPGSWEEFFDLLFKYRGVVAFDEFQWFIEVAPEVPFILQKKWDLSKEKPSVVITGSVVGMVRRLVAEAGAPLFGRADLVLELIELEPWAVFQWLSDMGVGREEAFKFYLLFGGVPYYYRLCHSWGIRAVEDAVRLLVAGEGGPLKTEPEVVLAESLGREYKTHLAILDAIARGRTKLEEIASYAGVKATSLTPYLKDLTEGLGLLVKYRGRRPYYQIRDRYYAFWLRAVYRWRDVAPEDRLLDHALRELEGFYPWAFEAAMREVVHLFYPVSKVAKEVVYVREGGLRRQIDVDIYAVNEEARYVVLAEAKWGRADPAEEAARLKKAAEALAPRGWEVRYAVFAREVEGGAPGVDAYDLEEIIERLSKPQTSA
ncbi:MAG: ATP-binding protein [Pyrobaculum sp.]